MRIIGMVLVVRDPSHIRTVISPRRRLEPAIERGRTALFGLAAIKKLVELILRQGFEPAQIGIGSTGRRFGALHAFTVGHAAHRRRGLVGETHRVKTVLEKLGFLVAAYEQAALSRSLPKTFH